MAKSRNTAFLKRTGLKIKQLRTERGVTQEDFYNDTGIHIGRIETGKRDFSLTTLQAICHYFKITPSELFEGLK